MVGGWFRLLPALLLAGLLRAAEPAPPQAAMAPPPAASPTPADQAPSALPLSPAVALAHRMEALKLAIQRNSAPALEQAIKDVELLRRIYGTMDLSPLVDGLLVWSRDASRQGRAAEAMAAVKLAERWAPGDPEVLATRVVVMRAEGLQGYFASIPDVLKLNSKRLGNATYRWLWLVQHLAWVRFMATLLLWGWALTLVLRYRRVLRHIWEEGLQQRGMKPVLISLIGAVILAFPVLVGLDPSYSAMLAVVLLAPFLYTDEVKVSILVLALQLVHPPLVVMEPYATREPLPQVSTLQSRPQAEPLRKDVLERLSSPDLTFLRGWEQLTLMDWVGAQRTFRELEGQHPDQGQVHNNLGVAAYHLNQKEEAAKAFEKALGLLPKSPEVLVNQSVLAFEKLDTLTGAGKQDEARKADPVAFERLMAVNSTQPRPRTFPLPLPDSAERSQALASSLGMSSAWSHRLKFPGILLGVLGPLAGVGLFMRRLRQSVGAAHPTQCVRCGEPFHTTDSPDPNVCPKCHHLFVLRDGLHQESRKKKIDEVGVFQAGQRRIHRLLLVLLPGCDVAFLGNTLEGLAEFAALTFALGLVLATGQGVRYPGEILADPTSTWLPMGAILLGILYIRSWMKLLSRRA